MISGIDRLSKAKIHSYLLSEICLKEKVFALTIPKAITIPDPKSWQGIFKKLRIRESIAKREFIIIIPSSVFLETINLTSTVELIFSDEKTFEEEAEALSKEVPKKAIGLLEDVSEELKELLSETSKLLTPLKVVIGTPFMIKVKNSFSFKDTIQISSSSSQQILPVD